MITAIKFLTTQRSNRTSASAPETHLPTLQKTSCDTISFSSKTIKKPELSPELQTEVGKIKAILKKFLRGNIFLKNGEKITEYKGGQKVNEVTIRSKSSSSRTKKPYNLVKYYRAKGSLTTPYITDRVTKKTERLIRRTFHYYNGKPQYTFHYDKEGNAVKQTIHDKKGKIINTIKNPKDSGLIIQNLPSQDFKES